MKLSLNWLKDYVELPDSITPQELAVQLTMSTVEVEKVESLGEKFGQMVVGKVTEIAPHPGADRLRLVTVEVGETEPCQVVCGASNLSVGMLVAYAKLGAKVRWHGEGELIELKEAEIRGVKSCGMICAAAEIGLDDLFPAKAEKEVIDFSEFGFAAGRSIADALSLNDVIIEIDNKSLTNRPDLWGHLGIARELSAIFNAKFIEPKLPDLSSLIKKNADLKVCIDAPELCRRYIGVAVNNVAVKPSPLWIQTRLVCLGQRPINLIVDLTNYVMFAVGQPLHAFDSRKVTNSQIVVRNATKGEKLTLLDDSSLTLSETNLVIADGEKPLALAGIMGGKDSGIAPDVTSLLLEAANFEAVKIRRTASSFKLRTESSMRFEKAIDTDRVQLGMEMLIAMLLDGYPEANVLGGVDLYPKKPASVVVEVDSSFISSRIGKDLPQEEMMALLVRLGYQVKVSKSRFTVTVPSWRATGDVSLPEDIVEEVARLYGYDNLEFIPLEVKLTKAVKRGRYQLERAAREHLAYQAGMSEIFSYPWCEEDLLIAAGVDLDSCLALSDAPSQSQRRLHPTLVAQLLGACRGNLRFFDSFSLFEMARVFRSNAISDFSLDNEKLPYQPKQLAGAVVAKDAKDAFFRAKGILDGLFGALFIKQPHFRVSTSHSPWVAKGAALGIFLGEKQIGEIGVLSGQAKTKADISRGEVAIFEFDFDSLEQLSTLEYEYTPLPKYPQTDFDFSFLFDEQTAWSEIEAISSSAHHFVKTVKFIDEYRGQQVPEGKKSLAFRVTLGNPEGSLTSADIQATSGLIIKKLSESCGGVLRAN